MVNYSCRYCGTIYENKISTCKNCGSAEVSVDFSNTYCKKCGSKFEKLAEFYEEDGYDPDTGEKIILTTTLIGCPNLEFMQVKYSCYDNPIHWTPNNHKFILTLDYTWSGKKWVNKIRVVDNQDILTNILDYKKYTCVKHKQIFRGQLYSEKEYFKVIN